LNQEDNEIEVYNVRNFLLENASHMLPLSLSSLIRKETRTKSRLKDDVMHIQNSTQHSEEIQHI